MYLLDTNICIYALNGRSQPLLQKLLSIHPDEIAVSAITVMELATTFGVESVSIAAAAASCHDSHTKMAGPLQALPFLL